MSLFKKWVSTKTKVLMSTSFARSLMKRKMGKKSTIVQRIRNQQDGFPGDSFVLLFSPRCICILEGNELNLTGW